MFVQSILKFTVYLHLFTIWSGAILGGYESYTNTPKYFAIYGDDLYTGSARGLIRGAYYPYNTMLHVPKVWLAEKPIWA